MRLILLLRVQDNKNGEIRTKLFGDISRHAWLGVYRCILTLRNEISAPSVQIVDALGEPLRDKYYEADSTIELLCVVRHIAMQVQYSVVQWLHGNRVLNYDTTRGGIR